jgi:DNA primase
MLRDTGLAFRNSRGKVQDAFRARVMFPIFKDSGEAVAFGGRVLPGSDDPAKYKNSSETPIYAKSRTLYGLNWAKAQVVAADEVIVCEGYTDVIGFFRAGVPRAVATCGTALTEDHVRTLKRFAKRVVLAFDADAAGQGAAERFYEWERKYEVSVAVAQFPAGSDPADLASRDPEALARAVSEAQPFLGFRLARVLRAGSIASPEARSRTAEKAMTVVNEHPDLHVRKLYAGQVATHVGIPAGDLERIAERRLRKPTVEVAAATPRAAAESAEFIVIALLILKWDDVADWLSAEMFADEVHRRAFAALGAAKGALEHLPRLGVGGGERAAVADVDAQPVKEAWNLLAAAVRRRLAHRRGVTDPEMIRADRDARLLLEHLEEPDVAESAAQELLGWLHATSEGDG